MVATRRTVRGDSSTKTDQEQPCDVQVQDIPSTGRRTRRAAKLEQTPVPHPLAETSSKLKSEGEALPSPPTSQKKICTRASRLHNPEQASTPVGSIHEADNSDVETGCSSASEAELPETCTRQKRQSRARKQAVEEVSEVDSCSSVVSGSKPGYNVRQSTRRKTAPKGSDTARAEKGDVKDAPTLETRSRSSVVSESQTVTRSQRKTARTRSTTKQHTEDSELSDADSCPSGASRRRSRRRIRPIPLDLDEMSESSLSPVRTSRRTRAVRGKMETTVDVSEPPCCESEGFESGPTYSLANLRRGRSRSAGPKATDSDSEVTCVHPSVGSPASTRGRGTPCSSRTGSGTSSRSTPGSRSSVKECSVVLENAKATENDSLNDSRLESTVIAEEADCTLLEANEIDQSVEPEGIQTPDLTSSEANTDNIEKEITGITSDFSQDGPSVSVCDEDTRVPAVIAVDQQEEPSTENKDRDASKMEMMQATVSPSEPSGPCPSVTVTICEKASEMTEEEEEEQEAAGTHQSETEKPLNEDAEETRLDDDEEEKMEVNMLKAEAQQVLDASASQAELIHVTSIQPHKVTVDSEPEQRPKDVAIQKTKIISLLDSSDDEGEFDSDVSNEEDLEPRDEEKAGPSNKSQAAAASVDRLFMIDTRPGQEADEEYYTERREEEAEQEEDDEFVDEEVDDDDEDAKVLFSSRDSHSKELSSRIDPGIRLKELGGLYISFDGSKSKPDSRSLQKQMEKKIQDEVMKNSVIGPDFEKKDAVPPYSESKQALKLKRRAERDKSTGDGWFNMKAPEMTQELKGDLQVLKMRGSLDSKRFYKKNDRDGFPKYFQFGTVVDSPVDFYQSRIPKKERKRTMVEELLADADFRHQNKKRFQHIMAEKAAQGAGKRNKKKHKFHKS